MLLLWQFSWRVTLLLFVESAFANVPLSTVWSELLYYCTSYQEEKCRSTDFYCFRCIIGKMSFEKHLLLRDCRLKEKRLRHAADLEALRPGGHQIQCLAGEHLSFSWHLTWTLVHRSRQQMKLGTLFSNIIRIVSVYSILTIYLFICTAGKKKTPPVCWCSEELINTLWSCSVWKSNNIHIMVHETIKEGKIILFSVLWPPFGTWFHSNFKGPMDGHQMTTRWAMLD